MNKITFLLLLCTLGVAFGQSPTTLEDYVNDDALKSELLLKRQNQHQQTVMSRTSLGGITTYNDRADYLLNCSNGDFLTLEDLADGPGGFLACSSSISSTGDVCYPAGEIQEGIEFTTSGAGVGNTMVAVVPADGFTLDNAVGSITFLDFTIINFTTADPVTSVGFDLYSLTGGSSVDVRVIGAGGLIETITVDVSTTGPVFVGLVSPEEIVSLELEDLTGVNVELVAQVLFGSCGAPSLNDDPATAYNLTVGEIFPDFVSVGDNTEATASEVADPSITAPSCSNYGGGDLWYRATVPASGKITFETKEDDGSITDTGMNIYEGEIGALVEVACNDDGGAGFFSLIGLEGRTPGEVLYARVFEYAGDAVGTFQVSAYDTPPPANDDLEGVIALTVGAVFTDFPVVGSNVSATASEVADPTITDPTCSNYGGGDIWYSAVVPSTGEITIETNSADGSAIGDTGMSIYEGEIGALVEVECDDDDSDDGFFSLVALTGRTAGEVLYIRVFEYGNNAFGDIQVAAYSSCAVNAGEIEITGGGTEISICSVDGSPDPIEVTNGGTMVGTNMGWVITDDATGEILGLPTAPPFDLDGAPLGVCNIWYIAYEDGLTGLETGMNVGDLAGCFDLSNPIVVTRLDSICPPANDNICNAIALTVDATSAGDAYTSEFATAEAGEPEGSCFNDGINGSVWFTFEAPASGNVQVTTDIAGGTHTDTEIAVYEAPSDCADASTLGAELGCDQDGGEVVNFNSIVELTGLTAGTTYYVQVDRWGTAEDGTFGIEVLDLGAPPVNDDICNAIALTINETSAGDAYTNEISSAQTGEVEGSCFNGGINGSVWFTFVAPEGGGVRVTTDIEGGTLTDTEIAVYEAPTDCADASTMGAELGCDQDGGEVIDFNSIVELTGLTTGTTYYVQVDRWGSASSGTFGIEVISTLSTSNFSEANEFRYYPNPTNGILSLRGQNSIENVSIVNMLGQEVMRIAPNSISPDIDMTKLQSGTYFVKVTINNVSKTIKIVKK